jgi:methyl-accepting chemotaxis protein
VQQTAVSTQDVTSSIGRVSQAASTTGSAARKVLQSAGGLSTQAGDLTTEMQHFLADVRAA